MDNRRMAGWIFAAAIVGGCNGGGDDTDGATTDATVPGTAADPTTGPDVPGDTTTTTSPATTVDPDTSADPSTADPPTTVDPPTTGEDTGETTTADPPTACVDDCHFVRAGADGSGADWADALPALPDVLERGHVYFLAAGTYPAYTFDDPESGDLEIRVLRATAADHGTDVGWDPAYAEGGADLGQLVFTTGRYHVDGRGAARAVGEFEGTVVDIGGDFVEFRGFDVDGAFVLENGQHVGGACTGMSIGGDDVVVAANRIHDAADDGVAMGNLYNLSFTGNTVHALHGCGTDGGCGPCYNGHSDGLELFNVKDSEVVGNFLYDIASTSAVFFGNWADELGMGPPEYCENILLANNIIYNPQTGFVAYIEDVVGIRVLNNVMWGLHMGAYGGLSIGTHVQGLDLYNNAVLSINYTHIGGSYDPAEHRGDHNLFAYSLGQWQDGPNDVVAVDPLFAAIPGGEGPIVDAPAPADFAPQAGSPLRDAGWPGDAAIVLPAADFFGAPRDATPNIGAIE